jgi:hypothetical protein
MRRGTFTYLFGPRDGRAFDMYDHNNNPNDWTDSSGSGCEVRVPRRNVPIPTEVTIPVIVSDPLPTELIGEGYDEVDETVVVGTDAIEPTVPVYHTIETKGVGGAADIQIQTDAVPRHDIAGVTWVTPAMWKEAEWDGIPYDKCNMTREQLCKSIFPNVNTMRGLEALYNEKMPFLDPFRPTVGEIETWNLEVIRHLRKLLGITHPVDHSQTLYLKAQWASERKHTVYWDTKYPGVFDSAYGRCVGGRNAHCGATFVPDAEDQEIYLKESNKNLPVVLAGGGGAEGIAAVATKLPWVIKLSRIIGMYLCAEGLTGHTGPFVSRRYYGDSWVSRGESVEFRGKWNGPMIPACP